jgi:hypothetical protein
MKPRGYFKHVFCVTQKEEKGERRRRRRDHSVLDGSM